MKSDQGTNVRFVQTVQAYPCLYDHSTKDYSNRNAQDKAWAEIGKKFDTTIIKCKERWKNLRGCYTRYLKVKSASGFDVKVKNAYYLEKYFHFLEPFTKPRKQIGAIFVPLSSNNNSNDQEEYTARSVSEEADHETGDTNIITEVISGTSGTSNVDTSNSSFIKPGPQLCTSSKTKSTLKNKRNHSVGLEDVNKVVFDFFSQKKMVNPIEEDVDLCFFKSLLPDMKQMNPEQKRRFKIGILNLSGNILNDKIPNEITKHYNSD